MDPRLREMLDHYEITKTLKEYCFAADRCDAARLSSVYLEDSWDDHGIYSGPGPAFARLMTTEIARQTETLFHLLGQSQISVHGDSAGAETYFLAVSRSAGEDGGNICNQLGGRFVDRLKREQGRWLIEKRTVVRDWSISLPILADWTADVGLKDGSRSNSDPAFDALRITHSSHPAPGARDGVSGSAA